MAIARIASDTVVEIRDMDLNDVPPHKRGQWLPVVYEGQGLVTRTAIEVDRVVITRSVPAPTIEDVRSEAQRRIIHAMSARDLQHCLIKQLNANMRANELNDIRHERTLTAEEEAEADALRSMAEYVKSVRAASNVLEAMNPIPDDYADNSRWQDMNTFTLT